MPRSKSTDNRGWEQSGTQVKAAQTPNGTCNCSTLWLVASPARESSEVKCGLVRLFAESNYLEQQTPVATGGRHEGVQFPHQSPLSVLLTFPSKRASSKRRSASNRRGGQPLQSPPPNTTRSYLVAKAISRQERPMPLVGKWKVKERSRLDGSLLRYASQSLRGVSERLKVA